MDAGTLIVAVIGLGVLAAVAGVVGVLRWLAAVDRMWEEIHRALWVEGE